MVINQKKEVERIILAIKKLKVQGATNVMRAGVKAYLLLPTEANKKRILAIRSTEPLLQNALEILEKSKNKEDDARHFLEEVSKSHEKITEIGSKIVKGDINVFSHCHSSTVVDILKRARDKRQRFVVYTVEVEPRLQGRMTARELAAEGIKVVVGPDLALEHLLERCDLVLFGADAFSKRAVYNKIGTKTICDIAKRNKIPVYACGVSLKFSKKKVKIEKRIGKEVWDERNKNIKIVYPAFDRVPYKLVSGIICETGIISPKNFVKYAKKKLEVLRG